MTDTLYRGPQKITVLNRPPNKKNPLHLTYHGVKYQVSAVLPSQQEAEVHPQIFHLLPDTPKIVVSAIRESVYGFVLNGSDFS